MNGQHSKSRFAEYSVLQGGCKGVVNYVSFIVLGRLFRRFWVRTADRRHPAIEIFAVRSGSRPHLTWSGNEQTLERSMLYEDRVGQKPPFYQRYPAQDIPYSP